MSAAHYARKAESALDGVHDWQGEEGMTDATMLTLAIEAQTQATLALVEQQRIANLIAYASHRIDHNDATAAGSPTLRRVLARVDFDIRTALDVGTDDA